MIWWVLPVVVGAFGTIAALAGLRRIFKLRMVSGGWRFVFGGVFLGTAGVMALVGLNLQTYSRLTHESEVAIVSLSETGPQTFNAHIEWMKNDREDDLRVRGDEIRFEARILKWEAWANVIGYDAVYRLDRVSGRYADAVQERVEERTIYAVAPDNGIDFWQLIRERGGWQRSVDAIYGDGVYVPMADGAVYKIFMTQSGLVARPDNLLAETAIKGWE